MLRPRAVVLALALACVPAFALAQADAGAPEPAAPAPIPRRGWDRLATAAAGPPQAIGVYTNGCVQGATALAVSGPGYEVLHLGRNRHWGHPDLVGYVRRLGAAVKKRRLGLLLVGDLAQPRGGPTPFGHRSHQSGLDVDLGYTHPSWMVRRKPTPAEREALHPPAVVDLRARALNAAWHPRIVDVLALAAADPAVDRIFVHPAIKRAVCEARRPAPGGDTVFLRKLRPWWGHHDHFHVRLSCPAGSPACRPQEPLPPGDGCDALAWWFTDDARKTQDDRRQAAAAAPPPPMPEPCRPVFAADTAGQPPSAQAAAAPETRP